MSLFSALNHNEEAKNKSKLKVLLDAASSDGVVDSSEFELIVSIAGRLNISREEVLSIQQKPDSIKFNPPSSDSAKIRLIQDLVKVVLADNKIEEAELRLCKNLAIKMNLNTRIIDDLIILNINQRGDAHS